MDTTYFALFGASGKRFVGRSGLDNSAAVVLAGLRASLQMRNLEWSTSTREEEEEATLSLPFHGGSMLSVTGELQEVFEEMMVQSCTGPFDTHKRTRQRGLWSMYHVGPDYKGIWVATVVWLIWSSRYGGT